MQSMFTALRLNTVLVLLGTLLFSACGGGEKPAPAPPDAETSKPAPETTPPPFNSPQINFEHFGNFDLATWKSTPAKINDSEGDTVMETVTYAKDDATMTVETAQSEYHHEVTYTLKDGKGNVQKTHTLSFPNDTKELTETVNDYTVKPAKKFTRTQIMTQSWQQMTPIPTAATGAWKESVADQL